MIKYSTRVFFLSILAVIFTSSKGVHVNNLVNPEHVSPRLSSKAFVPYGSFEGWPYTQICFVENSERKYGVKCFAKNCPETLKALTKSSLNDALQRLPMVK